MFTFELQRCPFGYLQQWKHLWAEAIYIFFKVNNNSSWKCKFYLMFLLCKVLKTVNFYFNRGFKFPLTLVAPVLPQARCWISIDGLRFEGGQLWLVLWKLVEILIIHRIPSSDCSLMCGMLKRWCCNMQATLNLRSI